MSNGEEEPTFWYVGTCGGNLRDLLSCHLNFHSEVRSKPFSYACGWEKEMPEFSKRELEGGKWLRRKWNHKPALGHEVSAALRVTL